MAKFCGNVGFANSIESPEGSGIYIDDMTVRQYYGDVISTRNKWLSSGGRNDNNNLSMTISIVADPFVMDNFTKIKYVEYMGVKWKVNDAIPLRPRIELDIGGVWNGETN